MHRRDISNNITRGLLTLVLLLLLAGVSSAAEFWLQADALTKTMPDTTAITMWGFAECTANHAACSPATVPGPQLVVPIGDSTLTIHLKNNLTGTFTEPVSIVIPGQIAAMSPVWIDSTGAVVSTGSRPAGDVTSRMRSFTAETAVGATGTYNWTNLKPGTYLYHSGTHPAVQVQMGLYGAVTHNAAALTAYPGIPYDKEVVLLFSEIDPVLHGAVAGGTYGQSCVSPPCTMTSTMDFHPKYFLLNGEAYTAGLAHIQVENVGQKILLRFLNAGLKDYAPILQGQYMKVLAEDGNPLPYQRQQYSLLLAAGKTVDAIMQTTNGNAVPVYDRRLNLTDSAVSPLLTLIVHYYNSILGRAPEPGGAEYWISEINRAVSLGISVNEGFAALAKVFFNSSEYLLKNTTDTQFVTDLYAAFLNRTPDAPGLAFWLNQLNQGLTRNMLITQFANTTEFRLYLESIFGAVVTRPENNLVNDFYRGFLGRLPDSSGFNFWLGKMRTAQCTSAQAVKDISNQIALTFTHSAEYISKNRSNSQFVEDLYNGILRRGADPAGFNFWVNALNTLTRDQLLLSFTGSPEFQGRVNNVINAGCLP